MYCNFVLQRCMCCPPQCQHLMYSTVRHVQCHTGQSQEPHCKYSPGSFSSQTSPNSSSSSSHSSSSASSIASPDSPEPVFSLSSSSMNTAHQVRVGGKPAAGRSKRFKAAKNHALAAALQSRFSEGSHKYHESPQRVNMKRRQAVKLQQGIHLTHLVIGAAQLGKCAGFSPHPGAQTKALESMLKQQNPARYQAFFDRHGCASDKQLAQQHVCVSAGVQYSCLRLASHPASHPTSSS